MKYINKYDVNISKIGLGTGRFGTRIDEERAFEMLDLFIAGGGNLLDTARNYYEWVENGRGVSEKTIGRWLESRKIRNKVYISTKGGVRNQGKKFIINLNKDNLVEELKESQDALMSKTVDFYLLHRDEPQRPVEEIMETLQVICGQGNVRGLGVCNWSSERIISANLYASKHGYRPLTLIQTWWSIAEYTETMWNDSTTTHMDKDTYDHIKQNNLVCMAYTSQAKGFFQKAIAEGLDNLDSFLKHRIATDVNIRRLNYIKEYCEENGLSPTAVINGYITSNEINGIALVSCSSINQLNDIINNCDSNIDSEFIKYIESIN